MAIRFDCWHLTQNGEKVGPFSTAALFQHLGSGRVGIGEWIWPDGADTPVTVQRFLKRVDDETLPNWSGGPTPCMELLYHIRGKEKKGPFASEKLMEMAVAGELRPRSFSGATRPAAGPMLSRSE